MCYLFLNKWQWFLLGYQSYLTLVFGIINLLYIYQIHINQQFMQQDPTKPQQQLKKFNFFDVQPIVEKIDDPKSHPIRLSDITVSDICMIGKRVFLLDETTNQIVVFSNCVEGYWSPNTDMTFRMQTNSPSQGGVLMTYGQDSQNQLKSLYLKFWSFDQNIEDYTKTKPKKSILVSKLGDPERIISCMHVIPDLTFIALGTKKGSINLYESKNILRQDYRMSSKLIDKRQIKKVASVRRSNEVDVYFANEMSFFWLQNLNEKKRINQQEVEVLEATKRGTVLVCFKSETKQIYEIKAGKEIRSWSIQGEKRLLRQFKNNYLITVVFQKRNQKIQKSSDKYYLQITDTLNQYIAYAEPYACVEDVLVNQYQMIAVVKNLKGERQIKQLTEKDNSYKIQTFFKRSFFNQAWRFAKNQNCQESLLAQISRLHGDLLYSKSDFANAIKQYIMTLGFVQPSYVIRKFLDVSQIDYLIEYLQRIHQKKLAKKEHTALLLNCYVKKQKIDNLSQFLSESALESDMFDIQTAIKVCKDLKHIDEAMKLAEQKNKHKLFLKILIQDKKDYQRALQHIKNKVEMQEKEKYVIEFGQEFMKFIPKKTIQLIKLLVRAHSISQIVRGRERDITLSLQEKNVLEQLSFSPQDLQSLTVITFKKPDQFFRLFLVNNQDLQDFLVYLVKDVPRLPNEQVVFHRLIQFYLQMIKENPSKRTEYEQKILENINHSGKKSDNNHLLALFKMYDFDEGIVTLCKKLNMRDDLLNFYIAKNRDTEILELCKQHGADQVNLWIHALKYFVKPDHKKEYFIPQILKNLSKIPNLSPLPILSILSKNKNIQYRFIKEFFLAKLRDDRREVQKDQQIVRKNMKKAEQSRGQFKKLKTTAKPFLSNNCAQCQNGLTFPSIHFMCGHSFHQNCLGGDKQCARCGFQMRNIIERKQRYAEGAQDQKRLFQTLQERRQTGFEVISEFLGRGMFSNLNSMQQPEE